MKDKAYYEDVNIKNELKLRDMIQKLPKFCMDFFIGIDADKSSRTKIAYAYDLQTFFEYMKSANPSLKKYDIRDYPISLLDQISPSDIEEYLFYLKYYEKDGVVHTNDERGIKRKLASLRTFYNFYFRKEFIDTNPASKVTLPKIHEKNIIRLDTDEVAQLLDEVESGDSLSKNQQRFHEKTKVRDLALMTLLLGTGIRVSECVGLDMDDVDFKNNGIKVHRKGGADVIVYFGDEVRDALLSCLPDVRLPHRQKPLKNGNCCHSSISLTRLRYPSHHHRSIYCTYSPSFLCQWLQSGHFMRKKPLRCRGICFVR